MSEKSISREKTAVVIKDERGDPPDLGEEKKTEPVKSSLRSSMSHKSIMNLSGSKFSVLTTQKRQCRFITTDMAEELDRAEYLRTSCRDFIIGVVFSLFVFIQSFKYTNYRNHLQHASFENYFITQKFVVKHGEHPYSIEFKEIKTIHEVWTYLHSVVLSSLYDTELEDKEEDLLEEEDKNTMLVHNHLLGVPRLRQLQVANNTCNIPGVFQRWFDTCYAAIIKDKYRMKDTFGESQSMAFKYQNKSHSPPYHGVRYNYYEGGYMVNLSKTRQQSRLILNFLKESRWITRATRFLSLNFAYYNGNFDSYCLCGIYFEMPRVGNVMPAYYFESLRIADVQTREFMWEWIVKAFIFAGICFYFFEQVMDFAQFKIAYYSKFLTYLNWTHISVAIIMLIRLIHYRSEARILYEVQELKSGYVHFEKLAYYYNLYRNWYGLFMFLSYLKLFKYMGINRTMRQLMNTLRRCTSDLVSFSIMFLVIFFAFGEIAYLLFGSYLEEFRNFNSSMFCLMRCILGDFDYRQIRKVQRNFAPLFFVFYVFFIFFVLLNMYMAIINDGFADVKTDLSIAPEELEMTDFLKRYYDKCLVFLHLRKKQRLGSSSFSLRAFRDLLLQFGFDNKEIDYFLNKYRSGSPSDATIMKRAMDDIDHHLTNNKQPSIQGPAQVTGADFFEHQERIESLENCLEEMIDQVESLIERLNKTLYVRRTLSNLF